MSRALVRSPIPIGTLVPHVVEASRTRAPLLSLQTGLGAPHMRAFRSRLDTIMMHVAELWPRADVVGMRSTLLMLALTDTDLTRADDDQLSAFCLRAAESRLAVDTQLTPIVDRDPRTGRVTIAAVEKVRGMIQLMREAGAKTVQSGTVYQHDHFKHGFDRGEREFQWQKKLDGDRGPVIAFFAIVELHRGEWQAKVLTVAEVEQLRQASTNPEHKAWRDYFSRMGELSALRAIADWIPQGPTRQRMAGPDVDLRPRPMAGLDPDDPYAPAKTTPLHTTDASDDTPDYVITEEPLFADVDAAAAERLPGGPHDLDGFGGRPIGHCPDAVLRRMRTWIARTADRTARYARLDAAIALVLLARRATPDSPSTSPTDSAS